MMENNIIKPFTAPFWPKENQNNDSIDSYALFRGVFTVDKETIVEFNILGAHWFRALIDNNFLTEGPARFPAGHPEYEVIKKTLLPGKHVVTAIVHNHAVDTRMLSGSIIKPFFACEIAGNNIPVSWKCEKAEGFINSAVRTNPQFSWIEWVNTKKNPVGWQKINFDDSKWENVVPFVPNIGTPTPLNISHVCRINHTLSSVAEGKLNGPFDFINPPEWAEENDVTWYKRSLITENISDADGIWKRYDLQRVRLGSPEFIFDLPENAVVEFALCEALVDGEVTPYINLSAGISRNLDHYIARGGIQKFSPVTPRAGRFLEIHIKAPENQIKFISEKFIERTYYGKVNGSFECENTMLNKIWTAGVKTLKACAEDAVTDNPTRERGQWTGDALPSTAIASVAYPDLKISARGLRQAAFCANEDGLVAGLHPGHRLHFTGYSLLWIDANVNYYKLTGDTALLEELFPYAEKNITSCENKLTSEGIDISGGPNFIDWGYISNNPEADIATTLLFYSSLNSMIKWCEILNYSSEQYELLKEKIRSIISKKLNPYIEENKWCEIGYHSTVLALKNKLIPKKNIDKAVIFIKRHILSCFPNNPDAPRQTDPAVSDRQLITPYFSYFTFPVLINHGEINFVLNQIEKCWGWFINNGLTTIAEVFDLNWSHCHVWSAYPTPLLSKYCLGIIPRYDLGNNHFTFSPYPGNLNFAKGKFPINGTSEVIEVKWERNEEGLNCELKSEIPVFIHVIKNNKEIEIINLKNKISFNY